MSNAVDEDHALALVKELSVTELRVFAANAARIALEGDFGPSSQQDLVALMRRVGLDPGEFTQARDGEGAQYDATFDFSMYSRMQVIVHGKVSDTGTFRVTGWRLDAGDYYRPDDTYVRREVAKLLGNETEVSVHSTSPDAPEFAGAVVWKDGGRVVPLRGNLAP